MSTNKKRPGNTWVVPWELHLNKAINKCYFPHMQWHIHSFVELVFIFRPVLDVYRDRCWNVWGKLGSKIERMGLRLAPARHALINIDAAEAV